MSLRTLATVGSRRASPAPPSAAARGTMPSGAVQSTVPSGLAPRATTRECER